ncbi:MAG: imelysin family protein [Oceanospirillales bacterium]|nr:imelysin family protein [Oceanospirillales bacterium]
MKHAINTSLLPTLAGASAIFLLAGVIHINHAAAQSADWPAYNAETLQEDILPRYQHFASEASELADAGTALCQKPDAQSLEQTRAAFRSTLNAWQGISHIQFGPVTYLMRNYSIEFWPDRKSIGRKQLRATLELPADTAFDDEFFHQASVSIKGLPALEQLLYGPDALSRLQQETTYCRLTQAISGNIADMANGIYQDWQKNGEQLLAASSDGGEDETSSADIPAISTDLMKSLVEPIELIRDTKLLAVMGKGPDATYPHRAENWMSEQSLVSIRANLDAAHDMFTGSTAGLAQLLRQRGEPDMAKAIEQQFQLIDDQLEPLGDSLTAALDNHYEALKSITDSLKVLDVLLNKAVQSLDIQLGFNSRDGD